MDMLGKLCRLETVSSTSALRADTNNNKTRDFQEPGSELASAAAVPQKAHILAGSLNLELAIPTFIPVAKNLKISQN